MASDFASGFELLMSARIKVLPAMVRKISGRPFLQIVFPTIPRDSDDDKIVSFSMGTKALTTIDRYLFRESRNANKAETRGVWQDFTYSSTYSSMASKPDLVRRIEPWMAEFRKNNARRLDSDLGLLSGAAFEAMEILDENRS